MKILIVAPNWVGDAVMATPTMRAVRRKFSDAEIVGLMRPPIGQVLEGTPWLDRVLVYNPRSSDPDMSGRRVLERLRAERFDLALILPNSFRTAVLTWRAGIPRRVGYARDIRSLFLTDALPLGRYGAARVPRPVLDYYLQLAYYLGCPAESCHMDLATTTRDDQAAADVWRRHGLDGLETVVAFNSGGAYGAAKHWPGEYFAELARSLVHRPSTGVLVLCGPAEHDMAAEIVRQADHPRVVSLAGQPLGIGLTKACVRRSDLLVTTDSGPRHFAAAFDVPVVTLFGPTHIAWSETYYPKAVHLQHDVECGPCQQRVCPYGHHRCMRELTVDRVHDAVVRLLESAAPSPCGVAG